MAGTADTTVGQARGCPEPLPTENGSRHPRRVPLAACPPVPRAGVGLESPVTDLFRPFTGGQAASGTRRSLAGPAARNVMSRKTVMPARSSATLGSLAIRYQNRHHGALFGFGCLQCRSN